MPPKFTEVPDMATWSQCIGGFIINFGIAEFLTLRCVEIHAGAQAAIAIRKKKLSDRIQAAKVAIEGSKLPAERKRRAIELWDEIGAISRTRNRLAHNPLVAGRTAATGELVFSVVDLQKMVPVGDNILEPLSWKEIEATALRVRDITRELGAVIEITGGAGE